MQENNQFWLVRQRTQENLQLNKNKEKEKKKGTDILFGMLTVF